jgi:four helix bundle protein
MIESYKELIFWKTARETSLSVYKLIKKLPNERPVWIIADQLLRAAFSIGANIAEGFGKYKGLEYSRFIRIALGSANEARYWLELLEDLFPQFKVEIDLMVAKNMETIKMLTATVKSLANNRS